jgi:hypothetical protein
MPLNKAEKSILKYACFALNNNAVMIIGGDVGTGRRMLMALPCLVEYRCF